PYGPMALCGAGDRHRLPTGVQGRRPPQGQLVWPGPPFGPLPALTSGPRAPWRWPIRGPLLLLGPRLVRAAELANHLVYVAQRRPLPLRVDQDRRGQEPQPVVVHQHPAPLGLLLVGRVDADRPVRLRVLQGLLDLRPGGAGGVDAEEDDR